jgi:hypothetical protein
MHHPVLRCRVIFEDIFEGKENVNCEAENRVYINVVISDAQEVLFCHSFINYYKVNSFIIVLHLLTYSGGSVCIGSHDGVPYLQQKTATHTAHFQYSDFS